MLLHASVWHWQVTGPSLKGYAQHANNVIFVTPRVAGGVLAEFVIPSDITIAIKDADGLVRCRVMIDKLAHQSCFKISYKLRGTVTGPIRVRVTVCGVSLEVVTIPACSAFNALCDDYNVCCHDIYIGGQGGIGLNADGTLLAVSCCDPCCVDIYEVAPEFKFLKAIGKVTDYTL